MSVYIVEVSVIEQSRSHEILGGQGIRLMAQVGVAFALCTRSAHALGGSGDMAPLENFGFLDHLRALMVHSEG